MPLLLYSKASGQSAREFFENKPLYTFNLFNNVLELLALRKTLLSCLAVCAGNKAINEDRSLNPNSFSILIFFTLYRCSCRTKVEDKYEKLEKLNKKIGEKVKQVQKDQQNLGAESSSSPERNKHEVGDEDFQVSCAYKKYPPSDFDESFNTRQKKLTQLVCGPLFAEKADARVAAARGISLVLQANMTAGENFQRRVT